MSFRWSLAPPQPLLAQALAVSLGRSPLLAQCLLNRGLGGAGQAAAFLQPRLRQLADPFLLPDMNGAVERLWRAGPGSPGKPEPIVIFGDYDVDGVTATTLLVEVLTALSWSVEWYLPHRLEEGYGLSRDGVENCLKRFPCSILLAVDCGSTSNDTIRWLQDRGVDVLVFDHHQVSDPAPPAKALVNPRARLPGSAVNGSGEACTGGAGAYCELSSVGIAFKLAHALVKRGRQTGLKLALDFDLRTCLDLVALGTIADLVPLTGENRILVTAGLDQFIAGGRPGLKALGTVAGIKRKVDAVAVAFQLAPRLNAAGRLENAGAAVRLLLARDVAEANPIALELDARNRQRQDLERSITEDAIRQVRDGFNADADFAIVHGQASWHLGVVGIVASKVSRQFCRPAIILGGDGDQWRGSGRSIEGFDLAAALAECSDLLVRHGGHAMAAGLSIHPVNLDLFRARLNRLARDQLKPEAMQPVLRLDAEVSPSEMTLDRVEELESLQPVGPGNPPIQLVLRDVTLSGRVQQMGKEGQHAKFRIHREGVHCDVIWWSCGDAPIPAGRLDLAFAPQINDFNQRRNVQLKVLDCRPASEQALEPAVLNRHPPFDS